MADAKLANRERLTRAIIEETKPEKTHQWSWDFMAWDEQLPILKLGGQHGTPDFELTFLVKKLPSGKKKDLVLVKPTTHPSWAITVETDFRNSQKTARDIVAATQISAIQGGFTPKLPRGYNPTRRKYGRHG